MIIVMAIISVLVAIAVPMYQKSLTRTRESLLKNNLFTLRTVIDEYTFDKKKAPQTLKDLVDQGYLRQRALDPMTGNNQSWRSSWKMQYSMVDQTQRREFTMSAADRTRRASKEPRTRSGDGGGMRATAALTRVNVDEFSFVPRSSNGRTAAFGAVNRGSNPCRGATSSLGPQRSLLSNSSVLC